MDIKMTDIMLHIDEELDTESQCAIESHMRGQKGVIGLGYHSNRPHLMIVEYNPDQTSDINLLHSVTEQGLHAELVGFL